MLKDYPLVKIRQNVGKMGQEEAEMERIERGYNLVISLETPDERAPDRDPKPKTRRLGSFFVLC